MALQFSKKKPAVKVQSAAPKLAVRCGTIRSAADLWCLQTKHDVWRVQRLLGTVRPSRRLARHGRHGGRRGPVPDAQRGHNRLAVRGVPGGHSEAILGRGDASPPSHLSLLWCLLPQIKKAYRVLALKYHPDKNKDKPDRGAQPPSSPPLPWGCNRGRLILNPDLASQLPCSTRSSKRTIS